MDEKGISPSDVSQTTKPTDNDGRKVLRSRIASKVRVLIVGLLPFVLLQSVFTSKSNEIFFLNQGYGQTSMGRWLMTTKIHLPERFEEKLADIDDPRIVPTKDGGDTPFYWHVLKSGGTTVKDWYAECLHLVEACEIGALEGHGEEKTLNIVEVNEAQHHVNVDTTVLPGILRAAELELVPSRMADIVFSPLLHESLDNLFSREHRGRMFAMLRHPVDRVVSLFYYLQTADWEPTYNPIFKDMTIEEYANSTYVEANWMVRSLINEWEDPITMDEFGQAKEILRRKCLVGLMSRWSESMDRFNKYFDFTLQYDGRDDNRDESGFHEKEYLECQERYSNKGGSNVHQHPKLEKDSDTYNLLKLKNGWDMELYRYIVEELFEEQRQVVDDIVLLRETSKINGYSPIVRSEAGR